jgi:hypothetical protein
LVRGEKENYDGGTTIFHGLIGGDLAESEKTDERMIDESRVLLAAGTDTTARALAVITYHLLADPAILKKLKSELETALPDPDTLPRCSQVETLPYLVSLYRFQFFDYGLPYDRMQSSKRDFVSTHLHPSAKRESRQMKISTTKTRKERDIQFPKA